MSVETARLATSPKSVPESVVLHGSDSHLFVDAGLTRQSGLKR